MYAVNSIAADGRQFNCTFTEKYKKILECLSYLFFFKCFTADFCTCQVFSRSCLLGNNTYSFCSVPSADIINMDSRTQLAYLPKTNEVQQH